MNNFGFRAQLIGFIVFGSLIIFVIGGALLQNGREEDQNMTPITSEREFEPVEEGRETVGQERVERNFINLEDGVGVVSQDPLANSFQDPLPDESSVGKKIQNDSSSSRVVADGEEVDVDKFLSSAEVDGLEFSDNLLIDPDTVSLYETMALFFGNLEPETLGLPDEIPFEALEAFSIDALIQGGIDAETLNTAMIKVLNEIVKAILESPELVNIIPDIQNLLDYELPILGGVGDILSGDISEQVQAELTALLDEVFTDALGELNIEELAEIVKLGDLYPSILSEGVLEGLGVLSENLPMDVDDLLGISPGVNASITGVGEIDLDALASLDVSQLIGAINPTGLTGLSMSMVGNINPGLITSCGSKHALNWPFRPKWRPGIYTCSMCERLCRLRPFQGFFPIPNIQYSYLWDAWSGRCGCG